MTSQPFALLKREKVYSCSKAQSGQVWHPSKKDHYVKSVHIRSFSGPYFPALGLNTEIYEVLKVVSELEPLEECLLLYKGRLAIKYPT